MQSAKIGVYHICDEIGLFDSPRCDACLRPTPCSSLYREPSQTFVLVHSSHLPHPPYKKRLGHFLFLGFSTPYPGVCFQKYKDYRLTFQCDSQ